MMNICANIYLRFKFNSMLTLCNCDYCGSRPTKIIYWAGMFSAWVTLYVISMSVWSLAMTTNYSSKPRLDKCGPCEIRLHIPFILQARNWDRESRRLFFHAAMFARLAGRFSGPVSRQLTKRDTGRSDRTWVVLEGLFLFKCVLISICSSDLKGPPSFQQNITKFNLNDWDNGSFVWKLLQWLLYLR